MAEAEPGPSQTERGRPMFVDEAGHTYHFEKEARTDGAGIWRCSDRKKKGCMSRIHVREGRVTKTINEHNHAASAAHAKALKVKQNLKRMAMAEPDRPPQQILGEVLRTASEPVLATLPKKGNLRRLVRVHRRLAKQYPAEPDGPDFELPEEYRTVEDEPFVALDTRETEPLQPRIIAFASPDMVNMMRVGQSWFVDGTFGSCPNQFSQLYTVHVVQNGFNFPVIFALLPNKNQDTYNRLFSHLHHLGANPTKVMMDFEIAASSQMSEVFPNIEIGYCFFHLTQSIWRHVQLAGLAMRYGNDDDFALRLRQIPAVAFLPSDDVSVVFDQLQDQDYFPAELEPILSYFERTYIGRPYGRNNRRRVPTFPIPTWNQYQRTLDGEARTNNACEAWHRSFNAQVAVSHPSIWKFVECLKRESALVRLDLVQHNRGDAPPPRKNKKYAAVAQRILTIVRDHAHRNVRDYLRGIAHNFSF